MCISSNNNNKKRLQLKRTFKNVRLKKSRIKLNRLIAIFYHMLMKFQLIVTERSITAIKIIFKRIGSWFNQMSCEFDEYRERRES